jgi:hypothetical protein
MKRITAVDADELVALRKIAAAANAFVTAIDTDEQIDAVSKQALNEWVDLASAVIDNRSALQL